MIACMVLSLTITNAVARTNPIPSHSYGKAASVPFPGKGDTPPDFSNGRELALKREWTTTHTLAVAMMASGSE